MTAANLGLPTNKAELELVKAYGQKILDPFWRVTSGALYKIIIKENKDDDGGLVVPFIPNRSQRRLIKSLWYRNLILKARQLGFTTLICILWLDHALFNANVRCGIVAQDLGAAATLFRDKVEFAYRNLPDSVRSAFPLEKDSADELLFAHNNSSIRVATSMRSGTIHRLHVSEFGKICAKYPDKALELISGTLPAVPDKGIVVIESTAEGRDGYYYKMVQKALKIEELGKAVTRKDYRMHFFAWWKAQEYRMPADGVIITEADHAYFDKIEAIVKKKIDQEQRAWYVSTRDGTFSGDEQTMWREYPSHPQEAFQVSTEGCWFAEQMTAARKTGRIGNYPLLPNIPCNTFWDIGATDGTAIWVHQRVGQMNHFVRFYEAWGEPYAHAVQWLQGLGVVFGTHYLPHDATHERQGLAVNDSPLVMLEKLMPGHRFEIVERTHDVAYAIGQTTRAAFVTSCFDESYCKNGIEHLDGYKKTWNARAGTFTDIPYKLDGHSEAADAYRQFAQGYKASSPLKPKSSRPLSWKTM